MGFVRSVGRELHNPRSRRQEPEPVQSMKTQTVLLLIAIAAGISALSRCSPWPWQYEIGPLIVVVWMPVGLITMFWALDRLGWLPRRYEAGHCKQCGYNLTGNVSGVCPECGTKV